MKKHIELNKEQKEILNFETERPVLVSAGPGAGKTFVIVERIKKIVNEFGYEDILVLTFSKKASNIIKKKLSDQNIFPEGTNLDKKILTFHSFGYYYAKNLFSLNNDRIMPTKAPEHLVKHTLKNFCNESVKSLQIEEKPAMEELVQLIKTLGLKCYLSELSQDKLSEEEKDNFKKEYIRNYLLQTINIKTLCVDEAIQLHNYYTEWKRNQKMIDYEDSLTLCLEYFYLKPEKVEEHAKTKYKFIFVDEFQDTNNVQFEMICELSKHHNNIFCVGDPRQSIFGFSGSSPQIFEKFKKKFPNTKKFSLSQNYRSTKDIIKIANDFSKTKNPNLYTEKDLFTEKTELGKIKFFCGNKLDQELEYITNSSLKLISENPKISIIILFKSKFEQRKLVNFLNKKHIAFFDLRKEKFQCTPELDLIVAACKHSFLHTEETDDSYLEPISKSPRFKLPKSDIPQFEDYQTKNNLTWLQTCYAWSNITGISKNGCLALTRTVKLLKSAEQYKELDLKDLIEKVFEDSGYKQEWKMQNSSSSTWKTENIEKYVSTIEGLCCTHPNLSKVEIIQNSLKEHTTKTHDEDGNINIHISTIHTAKGTEYDAVFLYALWQNTLPSLSSHYSQNIYHEEVNLVYVAITRARKYVFITTHKNNKTTPSDFYYDIRNIWCNNTNKPVEDEFAEDNEDEEPESNPKIKKAQIAKSYRLFVKQEKQRLKTEQSHKEWKDYISKKYLYKAKFAQYTKKEISVFELMEFEKQLFSSKKPPKSKKQTFNIIPITEFFMTEEEVMQQHQETIKKHAEEQVWIKNQSDELKIFTKWATEILKKDPNIRIKKTSKKRPTKSSSKTTSQNKTSKKSSSSSKTFVDSTTISSFDDDFPTSENVYVVHVTDPSGPCGLDEDNEDNHKQTQRKWSSKVKKMFTSWTTWGKKK